MVQTVPVNNTALSSCLKAALFLRCVGIRNIQQGGYWMFKGACRLDDLAHRHIIFIFPVCVKLFFLPGSACFLAIFLISSALSTLNCTATPPARDRSENGNPVSVRAFAFAAAGLLQSWQL